MMRLTTYLSVVLAALFVLLALPAFAFEVNLGGDEEGGGVDIEVSGSVNVRTDYGRVRKRNKDDYEDRWAAEGNVVLKGRLSYGRHALVVQVRPYMTLEIQPDEDDYSNAGLDEAYWNFQATDELAVTIGRRQVVNGVALGYNPTDFLSNDKSIIGTNLTDTERREERKGDNLIGFTKYFETAALQGYLIFPDNAFANEDLRGLVMFSHHIQPLQTDYTLSAYYDDQLKLGLNIASTISHSITAYAEAAFFERRDRPKVRRSKLGLSTPDSYRDVLNYDDDSDFGDIRYYDAVVGAKYTHSSGVNLNVEYWRSNTGYTNKEVNDIFTAVSEGRISSDKAEHLLSENKNQRTEKIFVRLSEIAITDSLNMEQTFLAGLNDKSFFMRTSFIWDPAEYNQLRFNVSYLAGSSRSEYGMGPYEWQFFTSYKHFF